jgi:lysozyme family protein
VVLMQSNLQRALLLIKKHEGGYVDNPKDPGGCTNMGITLSTFRRYLKASATCADVKALSWEQAETIYRVGYWQRVAGDDLPSGLDVHVFDMAVNAGPGTAVRLLQRIVGVAEDGVLGPVTLGAITKNPNPTDALVKQYTQARLDYYKKLSGWPTFGKGWANRLDATTAVALELAKAPVPQPTKQVLVVRVGGNEILRIIPTDLVSIMWEQA